MNNIPYGYVLVQFLEDQKLKASYVAPNIYATAGIILHDLNLPVTHFSRVVDVVKGMGINSGLGCESMYNVDDDYNDRSKSYGIKSFKLRDNVNYGVFAKRNGEYIIVEIVPPTTQQ